MINLWRVKSEGRSTLKQKLFYQDNSDRFKTFFITWRIKEIFLSWLFELQRINISLVERCLLDMSNQVQKLTSLLAKVFNVSFPSSFYKELQIWRRKPPHNNTPYHENLCIDIQREATQTKLQDLEHLKFVYILEVPKS